MNRVKFFLVFLLIACSKKEKIMQEAALSTPKEEKPIVVLTLSYNNSTFAQRNCRSVMGQRYRNFRWIYIDDASTDGTFEKVQELTKGYEKITLIGNETNKGAMSNMYRAISGLTPKEIVVVLDGDDWFLHEDVLDHINRYYADENVWLTYGQHVEYPSYTVGLCKPINRKMLKTGGFRRSKFYFSHLRTFYAGLFQAIDTKDLMASGRFLQSACDVATMLPMLEMAHKHAYFIRELLVVYNQSNPIGDAKKNLALQQEIEHHIRSLPPYNAIKSYE